jgi:hypothetical protein
MLEIRRRLDFREEPLAPYDGGQLGLQHLERDTALVPQVVGKIDGGHSALTDLSLDAVSAFQGSVQSNDRVGHVRLVGRGGNLACNDTTSSSLDPPTSVRR